MSHNSYYSMDSNPNNEGYSVMHSYPFINDGPKINNTDYHHPSQQKQIPATTNEPAIENCTRQVPPGVLHIKPTWKPVKLDEKPPFSYATIIAHAILSSEHRKLTLSEIYQWISEQYPCYSMKDHRWQNSIRHNLSLQKAFAKLERDTTTPSGKGCFWTILPAYEQQFIDNLVKRGLSTGGRKQQQPNNNTNHTTSHKQFKKLIDSNNSSNKANSHLFTIFRMSPTTTSSPSEPAAKRVKKSISTKKPAAIPPPPKEEIEYDSDCDSGVDLNCENYVPAKKETPVFDTTYSSLLVENSMFEDMFTTQQLNLSAVYFDNISTPSSIIDQNMFDPSETIYWPTNTYNNMEFSSSSTTTSSSSYGNDLYLAGGYTQDLFLQHHSSTPIMPNEDPSSYLLYNDYC